MTTSFLKFKYEDTNEEGWISVIDAQNMPNGPNVATGIVGTVWYIVSGENANKTAGKQILTPHDSSMFEKEKKFLDGTVLQIDGRMYDDSLYDGEENDDSKPYEYSITQIMADDNVYGQTIRPTKKGKLKATKMDKRTYVTGIHLSEENKWKTKSVFSQLMQKQAQKLYRKSFKIVEEQYPDQQQQQNIYAQFSPNLKHGVMGNKDVNPNVFMAQNYLVAPFKIYYVYLPTRDITIKSLSDLPDSINTRIKIANLITDKVNRFDAKFERVFNLKLREKPPKTQNWKIYLNMMKKQDVD